LTFSRRLPISDRQQEAVMNRKTVVKREVVSKDDLEHELEEGLKETFPASDPPTATKPVHHEQKKR
jgi:hypothetical protein